MWYNPFYSIVQFRVTTLRYRPKEAVPIEPNQQRHISTDGVKTTAGATGQPGAPAPKNKKKPKKRRSIIGMIFSFIGCMLCLCIMAASVGGVLLSMYIVQVTADDAETLDLDNQKNRQTSIVYDINGNEYASLSRNENRIWRELSAMPENLQNAVIAVEDKDFRSEPGINVKRTRFLAHLLCSTLAGIGVNVNQTVFDPSLPNPVSMAQVAGRTFDRRPLLERLAACIMSRYGDLRAGAEAAKRLQRDYHRLLYRLDEEHWFARPDGELFRGTIRGVEPSGALRVEDAATGEVRGYLFREIEFVLKTPPDVLPLTK